MFSLYGHHPRPAIGVPGEFGDEQRTSLGVVALHVAVVRQNSFSVVDEAYHVPSGARHVVGSGKSSDHTGASTAPAALNAANTASMSKPV